MVGLWLLASLLLSGSVRPQQPLLPGSCSFQRDACGYREDRDRDRDRDLDRVQGSGSWRMNQEGHLMTVDSSFLDEEVRAVLVSPVLDHRDWSCVRLVYQITGRGSLRLLHRPHSHNFDYLLWMTNTTSDSWLIASVDLPSSTSTYQIVLEGRPERGSANSVAIFEIHIVPGYCIECNFEDHHLCGYSNSWNPNVNWYVGGSVMREEEQPENNTGNEQRGHYMYVDSVYARHFQEVAKLSSPITTVPMEGCLTFYYQREQQRGNIFTVFTRDQLGHYEELWRPAVSVTAGWTLVSLDIKAPHPLELVFEVAFNGASGGHVSIDDVSFSPEFCHSDSEPTFDPSVANCDFDQDLCLYHQERGGRAWSRVSVQPNTYRTGDHSTGTGSYLLANARFSAQPGYVARLHGPFLPGNHRYCLRFYYLLSGFGKVDNDLVLYVYDENNVALERVWSLTDSSRTDSSRSIWTLAQISYQKPMMSKLVFVAICRDLWECGLVAIDDVTVTLGDCRMNAASIAGRCDFEDGLCGFIQDQRGDQADWLRVRGDTPTSSTGPRGDHSSGLGHFLYIEASVLRPGHRARLLSAPLWGSSSPHCLLFFYHMYGSGTGILSVFLRRHGDHQDQLLWRRRGEQSISWTRAAVDYDCQERHQVIFEAIRGPSLRSDIAIDDVEFQRGPCEDPTETAPYSGSSEYFNEIEN